MCQGILAHMCIHRWMHIFRPFPRLPRLFNSFVHEIPMHRAHPGPSHPGLSEIQVEPSDCRPNGLSRWFWDKKGRQLSPRSHHLVLQLNSLFRDSHQVQKLATCVRAATTALSRFLVGSRVRQRSKHSHLSRSVPFGTPAKRINVKAVLLFRALHATNASPTS